MDLLGPAGRGRVPGTRPEGTENPARPARSAALGREGAERHWRHGWRAVEAARETGGGPERPGEESWQRFARERAAVAEAWGREVVAKPAVAAELRAFAEAAGERLGYDAEKVLQRAEAGRGAPEGERAREGMAGVARALAAERQGRGAHEDREADRQRAREAQQERLGLWQGRGMRM